MTAEERASKATNNDNSQSKLPTNQEQAKVLAAKVKDLEHFEEFLIEQIEEDLKDTNLEIFGLERHEEKAPNHLYKKWRQQTKELQAHQNYTKELNRVLNKIELEWNFSALELETIGPWHNSLQPGTKSTIFDYSDLVETIEELKKREKGTTQKKRK